MIEYLNRLKSVLDKLDYKQINHVVKILRNANTIYVIGNGGSQSVAEHFVIDLIKYANKKAFAFGSSSLNSMIANDYGHEHSYRWIIDKLCIKDDVIVGLTTSGKSKNILHALLANLNVKTILITGIRGKHLAKSTNSCIVVEDDHTQIVEDVFAVLCHILALELAKEEKNGENK